MKIQDLVENAKKLDETKTDYIVECKDVDFNGDVKLNIAVPESGLGNMLSAAVALGMTDHALDQICKKLGPPPTKYITECPPWLAADNLNYWKNRSDKTWFVRADGDIARAVLSNIYTPILNSFVIDTISDYLGDTPHSVLRSSYLSPDTLHLKISLASSDGYREGFYVGNCEIGTRSFRLSPFIQRNSCENSIIYLDGGVRQRHAYVTTGFLKGLVKESIGQLLNISHEMLEKVVKREVEEIPDVAKSIERICKLKGLSQEVHDDILIGTEGARTRMGIVNGLSYAAQRVSDVELQHNMESWAGAILVEDGSIFSKLKSEYVEE